MRFLGIKFGDSQTVKLKEELEELRSVVNDKLNYQPQNPEHPSSNPNQWLLNVFGSQPTSSGVRVDPETAPAFSAVYRCVALISSTMALMPVYVYKQGKKGREKAPYHGVQLLLNNPTELYSNFVWKETMMQFALLWGNAYSKIIRNEFYEPIDLEILHPRDCEPFIGLRSDGRKGWFVKHTYLVPGTQNEYKKEIIDGVDIIHVPCMNFDGVAGKSPIMVARQNIGLGLAAEKFAGDFYKNDAAYSGIYTHPSTLNDEAYNRLKESLQQNSAYGEKSKTLLLEGGTDYKPITMPMRDAQFIESRRFQVEEICRMYGVPLHKVAEMSAATNNNIEMQALEFIQDCILAWCEKWESELDRKLFKEKDKAKFYTEFDMEKIQRGDSAARVNKYRTLFAIGSMSQNEIREAENMPPIENGDRYFIPLNMSDSMEEPGEVNDEEKGKVPDKKIGNPGVNGKPVISN